MKRWSPTKWLDTRHQLGRERDRLGALAYQVEGGYTPFDWQIRAHAADVTHPALRPHKGIFGGLGSGKSDWGIGEAGNLAIMNPGERVKGMITGPTNDFLKQEIQPRWEAWLEAMAMAKLPLLKKHHKTQMRYELWCGASVYLRSLERFEAYRGWQLAWWWGDEIESLINPMKVWTTLSNRVRQRKAYVREAFVTSTPRGNRGTVAHFLRERAKARGLRTAHVDEHGREFVAKTIRGQEVLVPRDELVAAHYTFRATSQDNPTLGDDYLLSFEGMSERRYKEEVLAEILAPESAVWPEFGDRHVIDWPAPWSRNARGELVPNPAFDFRHPLDLAFDTGDNYPHALWIQRLPGGLCIVVDEYCEDGGSIGKTHDALVLKTRLCRRAPDNIVGDRAVPEELGWMMQTWPNAQPHKMVKRVEQDVLTGVEVVRDRAAPIFGDPLIKFARHLTISPTRRGIWNCVRNYRYQVASDGSYHPRPHKDNIHDHGADALRMHQVALFGGDSGPRFFSVGRRW